MQARQKSLVTYRRILVAALAAAATLATSCGSADPALTAQTTITDAQPDAAAEEDEALTPAESDPDAPPADYDSFMAAENEALGLGDETDELTEETLSDDEQDAVDESPAPGTALFVEVENLEWETQAECLRKAGFSVEAMPANEDGITTYRHTSDETWDQVAAALGECGFDSEGFLSADQG